jgi:hypothetical protein
VSAPVEEALVNTPCVAKRLPVVVELVKVEDVAKKFCVKALRKRKALDPRERVISAVGRMSPAMLVRDRVVVANVEVPATLKRPLDVRLVALALASVVFPVTLSVVRLAVPMSAP